MFDKDLPILLATPVILLGLWIAGEAVGAARQRKLAEHAKRQSKKAKKDSTQPTLRQGIRHKDTKKKSRKDSTQSGRASEKQSGSRFG